MGGTRSPPRTSSTLPGSRARRATLPGRRHCTATPSPPGARTSAGPMRRTRCTGWASSSCGAATIGPLTRRCSMRWRFTTAPARSRARSRVAGNQRAAALTRLSLGDVSREHGDTAAARQQFRRAAADLERLGDPVAAAAAVGELAAFEAATGLPAAAESLYRAALARLGDRIAPEVTWRLHAGLALARRAQGAPDSAPRELRAALADVERPGPAPAQDRESP